jgi:hypothetical protein
MNRAAAFSASILLVTAACGGTVEQSNTGGAGTGGAQATTTSSATTTTSSSAASTSSSTSGGTGGQPAALTITLDSFTVPPGGEVYKCQNFANPFGADVEISKFESHMTPGSHHLLLFYKQGATNGALQDCSGLEFAATPYSTQLPDDELTFPDSVAALIPAADGFRVQSHYLNTTGSPITAHVEVTLHPAAPGTVTQHAGILFVVDTQIDVPPQSTKVVSHDCNLPVDMNLMKAASHMHQHGTNFLATAAGSTLYQTSTWNDPMPAQFDPPKQLHAGDPLHFECTFKNNGNTTLTFGESAATNEMCIFVGAFYPVPAGQVTIGCP